MVHCYLSTGMTKVQYTSFCDAANIGAVKEKTINTGKADDFVLIVVVLLYMIALYITV